MAHSHHSTHRYLQQHFNSFQRRNTCSWHTSSNSTGNKMDQLVLGNIFLPPYRIAGGWRAHTEFWNAKSRISESVLTVVWLAVSHYYVIAGKTKMWAYEPRNNVQPQTQNKPKSKASDPKILPFLSKPFIGPFSLPECIALGIHRKYIKTWLFARFYNSY